MSTDKVQVRAALHNLKPYSPGKPIWEVQQELGLQQVIKLASNENALGPSPKALEAVRGAISDLHRYPDAQTIDLRSKIADSFRLSPEQIIVTNGGDELIKLVSETFLESGDEIVVPEPSFSEYEFGGHLMGATVKTVRLKENYQYEVKDLLNAVTARTKLLFLCSPNNPTGTILSKTQLQHILDALPKHVLVVLDTAYSHYVSSSEYTEGIEFVQAGYPILILKTFSKVYGLAGIRVGFGVASQEIIRSILQVKEPFNVNALAQVAAAAAIEDDGHVQISSQLVIQERQRLYRVFQELGLSYTESMSNFILVKLGQEASKFVQKLMERGVIVRFGGIWGLTQHIRITIGTAEENDILIEKMRELLDTL
jgi:histidinol-phosphate aminotransferase